ncbi:MULTISPECIES: hypothetical protein [Bacillaceae]|nr:hypothetical protein [Bacillus sp. m3-13]
MSYSRNFLKVLSIVLLALGLFNGNLVSAADEDHPDPNVEIEER